jgi:hypothetical protein
VDGEIDLDGQHPFVKLGGCSVENQGFWYEDNFAGIWDCGWCGHDDGADFLIGGRVTERVTINDNSELSGDPLLIQLVRCPIWVNFVGVYSAELFKESGIGKSGKWGVETMRSPLFSMMEGLGAITVLLDGKVIEMMGVVTKA